MKTKINQLLLLIALVVMPVLVKAQWNHVRFDQYNTFTKVFTVRPDTVFVIGSSPTNGDNFIIRSNDGGATWDSIAFGIPSILQLSELFFTDVNNGFTGGYNAANHQVLLKTNDNGTTWTDITPDPTSLEPISGISFIDPLHGFTSTSSMLYTTVNGGTTWTSQAVPFIVGDIYFSDMNNGFACGTLSSPSFAVLKKTSDGGQTWLPSLTIYEPNLFVPYLFKENIVSPTVIYTSMQNTNKLFRTVDNGATWDTIVVDSVFSIRDFQFTDVNNGHVLSDYGQIFTTTDGGLTWALEYATEWGFYGPSIYLFSFSFVDEVGYVAGTSGLVKKHELTTNGITETANSLNNLHVYPNPLSGTQELFIQAEDISGEYKIEIVNSVGQIVYKSATGRIQNNSVISISGLNLSPGVYSLSVESKEKRSTQKLMIVE